MSSAGVVKTSKVLPSLSKNSTSKDKKSDDSTDDNSKRKNLFEIEFDEDGVAFVNTPQGIERLDQYMRY